MLTATRECPCEDATRALGRSLAHVLRPGDVLALTGELGAGKTLLARAIAESLGADPRAVASPTFVMINEYPVAGPGALRRVVHADAYRLHAPDELDALGWDRVTRADGGAADDAVLIVEWAERISAALPPRVQ